MFSPQVNIIEIPIIEIDGVPMHASLDLNPNICVIFME